MERDGAIAEIGHRLSLEPVWPSKIAHQLHRLVIKAERVAQLRDLETLQRLNVNASRYQSYDYTATQAIAAAAQFLGHDALLVPNARHPGVNLVVLLENLDPDPRSRLYVPRRLIASLAAESPIIVRLVW